MKIVKSSEWVRLRGQLAEEKKICIIDTQVIDKPRTFIVPETVIEKEFFDLDMMVVITGCPFGPVSHNPDGDWGWRCMNEIVTDQFLKNFSEKVNKYMAGVDKALDAARESLEKKYSSQEPLSHLTYTKLLN